MIGAGAVIAERFRGVAAKENGASVTHFFRPVFGVIQRQLQVLRADPVNHIETVIKIASQNHCTTVGHGGADNVCSIHAGQQALHTGANGVDKAGVLRHQNGLRFFVVFRL